MYLRFSSLRHFCKEAFFLPGEGSTQYIYKVPHSVSTYLGRLCHSVLKATTESKSRCHMHGRLQHTCHSLPSSFDSPTHHFSSSQTKWGQKSNNSWLSIIKSQACANMGVGREFCFCRHNYICWFQLKEVTGVSGSPMGKSDFAHKTLDISFSWRWLVSQDHQWERMIL